MVSEKSKLLVEINEALDMELLNQQIEHRVFDMDKTRSWILAKMLQLCAPVRDASIREIDREEDAVTAFKKIFDTLEDMKFDLMNYRLRSLRPVLSIQAVEYETSKFKEALDKNHVTLEKTKAWLSTHAMALQETLNARNPENIQIPENRVRFESVFTEAYLSLLNAAAPLQRETAPETLLLDVDRVFGFQNEIQGISVVAVIIMLIKNLLPELRRETAVLKQLKEHLFVLLRDGKTTLEHLKAQVLSATTPFHPKTEEAKADLLEKVELVIQKSLNIKDPVYLLCARRVTACFKTHIQTGKFKREGLDRAGLDLVVNELEECSRRVYLLWKHNKQVYGSWYDELLREILA